MKNNKFFLDVPDSYTGPRIEGKIDEKFVNELRQAFCDRVPLHKKYEPI